MIGRSGWVLLVAAAAGGGAIAMIQSAPQPAVASSHVVVSPVDTGDNWDSVMATWTLLGSRGVALEAVAESIERTQDGVEAKIEPGTTVIEISAQDVANGARAAVDAAIATDPLGLTVGEQTFAMTRLTPTSVTEPGGVTSAWQWSVAPAGAVLVLLAGRAILAWRPGP